MERNSPAREKEWKTKGGKKIAALKEAKGSEKPIREPQRHTNYSNQKFDKSEPLPLKKDTVGDTCSYNKDSLQQDRTHKQASGIQKLLRPKAKHTIQKQSDKSPQESTERTVNQKSTFRTTSLSAHNRRHTQRQKWKSKVEAAKHIVNLSSKVLMTEETLILHKGLSFIPTTSTPNRSQLLQDYKQYIRTLRLT